MFKKPFTPDEEHKIFVRACIYGIVAIGYFFILAIIIYFVG